MRENDSSLPETSLFSAINRGEVHSAEMYFSTFRLIRKIRFITLVCPFPPFALYYCLDKLYFVHTEAQRKLSLNSNYLPLIFFFQAGDCIFFPSQGSVQKEK